MKRPFVIAVLSQKGGVGKTTLSLNLAAHYALSGLSVLVVDADPQGSALAWSSVRQSEPLFPVVGMAKPTLHKDLPQIASDKDIVIIDAAPRSNDLAKSTIFAANLVLIPVQPSPFDVWAAAGTVELVEEARMFRPDLAALFVINRKVAKTVAGRDLAKAFKAQPFPVAEQHIQQRICFVETAAQGLTVPEIDAGGLASREIAALADQLITNKKRNAA